MTGFEKYLIGKGYKMYNYRKGSFVRTDKHRVSSMDNLYMHYVLNEDFDNYITFGLHEAGYPPTLMHPRPNLSTQYKEGRIEEVRDKDMIRALTIIDYDTIYKALFDRSIVLDID